MHRPSNTPLSAPIGKSQAYSWTSGAELDIRARRFVSIFGVGASVE